VGRKRKLRKKLKKRGLEDAVALVVCTGKKCCSRERSCALVDELRQIETRVAITTVGCLGVCKKGPIVATYPKIKIAKRVTARDARALVAKLERRLNDA
jgi:(2Fe-2S) ferredoxin